MFGQAVCCFLAAMLHLLWRLLERIWPAQDVELAPEFPSARLATGFEANPWAATKVCALDLFDILGLRVPQPIPSRSVVCCDAFDEKVGDT